MPAVVIPDALITSVPAPLNVKPANLATPPTAPSKVLPSELESARVLLPSTVESNKRWNVIAPALDVSVILLPMAVLLK